MVLYKCNTIIDYVHYTSTAVEINTKTYYCANYCNKTQL